MSNQILVGGGTDIRSDTVPLPFLCPLLWIGVAGDVAVTAGNDTTATVIKAVPVGWLPSPIGYPWTQVFATGTTATNIVAFSRSVGIVAVQAP